MLYVLVRIFFKPLTWLWYRPKVHNRRALRRRGKVIYVSNHISLSDPIVIGTLVPRSVHFMAKAPLFEHPVARFFLKHLLCFPVTQRTADRRSITHAVHLLEKGEAFGIFPEGHRSNSGEDMDALDKGCAFVAVRADAPIVPIYIRYGAHFWNRLKAVVGEPIYPCEVAARYKTKRPVDAVTTAMTDAFMTLKAEMEEF